MPPVDVAMAQSLRGGTWGTMKSTVINSFAAEVLRRDAVSAVQDNADEIKRAFTNWNVCMTKDYCKWPAFGIILLLSLVIIGVTICIIRCCCLGLSCCCACCRCLQCCGNCCGCCDPPGDRPHNYSNEPFNDQSKRQGAGYRQQAPMEAHFPPPPPTAHSVKQSLSGPPQYAEFDVKRADPDALPAMPSWEESKSKRMVTEEVEMDTLPQPQREQPTMQRIPPPRGPFPGNNLQSVSEVPASAYNRQQGPQPVVSPRPGQNQSMPSRSATNPLTAQGQGYDQNYGQGYDRGYDQGYDQGYGQSYDQSQPRDHKLGAGQEPNQLPDVRQQVPAASMRSVAPIQNVYGNWQKVRQAPAHASMQATVFEVSSHEGYPTGGSGGPYGSDAPHREYGNMSSYAAPASHQGEYGHRPTAPAAPKSPHSINTFPGGITPPAGPTYTSFNPTAATDSPITNNGGFDFNSGYARPQNHEESEAPGGYPGYKTYNASEANPYHG